jgi:predicted ATPase/class 3 adenylate cyclase/DNA-binding CsgD family transcriptional regulator
VRRLESASGLGRPLLIDGTMKGRESSGLSAFALPAGTVTFLLTDIAGSRRLWEEAADAMQPAVARHFELLEEAIARHGGVRPAEEGEGGSVVAAFARAGDALSAALDAQRALLTEDWPEGAELTVRMALHTGDARLRDEGNYFGAAVNRGARLRAIAHGGQVLVSRATHDLVEDVVPEGAELSDLGVHRLRDLGRPEHVFALTHPDLPAISVPLGSLDAHPNNLPTQLSSFVGRREELAELGEALGEAPLLTLTGAGGCGKTRLAPQTAADALDRYPDGAWWVELASLTDPERLGDALATAIGVRPLPGATAVEAATTNLASRRALVVLDNCEHLLGPCAALTEELLGSCPELTIMATSREPLGLPGEISWRVPSLSLPAERRPEPVESLAQSDAVRLFIERAGQVRPNFAVTNESAPFVAQICRELDGIPLAIELAAARVRMLSPEQIASGLADRFRLLTGGARTALPRQQTLRASVDWSHELLDEHEQVLLGRLGVFMRGFTLDLAEEVCGGQGLDRYAILDLLTSLVDKSLVAVEEHAHRTRYLLLETIRHFALDRLGEAGEVERVRNRHRDALLALAERVEPGLLSERQPESLQLLDAEAANLGAAIEWAAATEPELALRLCTALTFWWRLHGLFADGDAAFERALETAPSEASPLRACALWGRGYLAIVAGERERGERNAREALEMGEELEDEWIQGRALLVLATFAVAADPRSGIGIAKRSRELAKAAGDDFAIADATQVLGYALWSQDDYEAARRELDASLEVAERIGNRELMAWCWLLRGMMPFGSADLDRRRAELERGLDTSAEIGELASEGFGIAWLGQLEIWTGAPAEALERLERCLERLLTAGVGPPIATVQATLGVAQAALGRLAEARATLGSVIERKADLLSWRFSEALSSLAALERQAGDPTAARSHAQRALGVAEHVGSALLAAIAQRELGRQAVARGEWADAERLLHDSLAALISGEHRVFVPDSLEALAEVAAGLESHADAARLLAAAGRAREEVGIVRWTGEDDHWEALRVRLGEALGGDAYEAATSEGRELTMDETCGYVRRARGERKRPPGGWESLTPTELKVVGHVADGLTNLEIAERMFIARSTVKTHLAHIYAKLDLRNRSELAAAEAARRSGKAQS